MPSGISGMTRPGERLHFYYPKSKRYAKVPPVTFRKGACAKLLQVRTAGRPPGLRGGGHLQNSYMIAPRDASRGTRSLCRHADRSRTQRGRARIRFPDRRDPGRFDRRNPGASRAFRRAAHQGRLARRGRHRGAGGRGGLRHLRLAGFARHGRQHHHSDYAEPRVRARTPASSTPRGLPPAARQCWPPSNRAPTSWC